MARQGTASEGPQYPIASVDNALRLLLVFRDRDEIRLSEAAELLGVANSTAHRLLAMLAHHGFVRQHAPTKSYRAGSALVDVGLSVVRRMDVREWVHPLLETISDETGETVHCAVRDADQVRYVDGVESDAALRVAGRTGMVLPAHCSAAGKALLARLSSDEVRKLYPSGRLPQTTGNSIKSRAALLEALEEVRDRGYAINREESEDGVVAVGMVLDDDAGHAIAGISCASPLSRTNERRVQEIAATMRRLMETHHHAVTARAPAVSSV